jgi:antitoxin component YwqK of YwqJK toxin-antitoxin module
MFSSSLVDKTTGEDVVGWITGAEEKGFAMDVELDEDGKVIRKQYYSKATGALTADMLFKSTSGKTYPHGPQFLYHEDGTLKEVSLKHMGTDLLFKAFFKNGRSVGYETFVHGKVVGYVTSYWDNGSVKSQTKHRSGIEPKVIATCNQDGSAK